ncbi:CPSF A subunit region-domain-containing protein [Paraphysoderma sedebokerense]|nr:CPSF A subunit region-domain-containing protein [Paraphysoderma sedebokerense]
MSLKARENDIIAGHQKESVTYYKYDREDKKLVPLASDRFSRTISDLVFWGEHNLVGVDKYGNIFGLVYVPDSEEFTFHEVFCFHLGEICMRLETGSLVDRPESLDMEQLSMTLSQSQTNDMPATTSEQIIAATILGSIYVIQPISESEFNLLNVLQMALLNYPGSHPILNAPHDAFRGMQYPAHHLIDGVIVESFFRLQEAEREWIVQTMARIWMRKWRMGEAGFGNEHAPALATDLIETYDGIGLKEKSDMDNCIEGLSVGMLKAALLGMVKKTV